MCVFITSSISLRSESGRKLDTLLLCWLLGFFGGIGISLLADPVPTVNLELLLRSHISVAWMVVSVVVFIVLPVLTARFRRVNYLLLLIFAICKGLLAGFYPICMMILLGSCAWLVVFLFQITDFFTVVPVFILWNICAERDYRKIFGLCIGIAVLCITLCGLHIYVISPLIESIYFC